MGTITYPDARVRTDLLTGMIVEDTCTWGAWSGACLGWLSDNYPGAGINPKLNIVTDILADIVHARRAGTPKFSDGDGEDTDYQLRKMVPAPGCAFDGAMRAGETVLDNIGFTASSDQTEIRFDDPVKGVGCYLQLNANAPFTGRMRAYDSGGTQLGVSVIKHGTSCSTSANPITCPNESMPWFAIASDVAEIARVDVNVVAGHTLLTDAAFAAASEARFHTGSLVIGPIDPLAAAGTTTVVVVADTILLAEELIPGDPEGPIDSRSKLCVPFNLPDCSGYVSPENAAALLPEVYGDFTFGGLRGAVAAICIDTVNFVYAVAGHAVTSIIAVFVDDVEQTIGVDCTINLATDYDGQGILGVIVFPAAPGGQVSWRGTGRAELDGSLITNPIRQLEYALRRRAGFITEYFEATALAQAKFDCDTLGYQTAWVIGDDREIQQWLTEWLFNVMGFWRVDGRERLQFMVDAGGSPPESQLVGSIIASRDVVDGDDGVEMLFDRQHLVNDLTAYYLYSWSLNQPSSRIVDFNTDLVAQRSRNAHGEVRKAVTLRGLRVETMLRTWASILFQRQGFASRIEGAILSFTVKHAKLIHATVGDYIALTWAWGPTREEGNQYINEILRIQAVNHDFARGGRTKIRAIDLGAYISASESEGRGAYFDADDDDQYNAELFFGGGRLLVPLP